MDVNLHHLLMHRLILYISFGSFLCKFYVHILCFVLAILVFESEIQLSNFGVKTDELTSQNLTKSWACDAVFQSLHMRFSLNCENLQ